jgi:hypothetical protein
MQAHGLPVWLAHGGWLTVAAIVCIDAAILYLAARGRWPALIVAGLGMFVTIAGPLYAVAEPAWDSWNQFEAATTKLDELPEVEKAIKESEQAIEIMYGAGKVTLAQPHRVALDQARARKAELLKVRAEEANSNQISMDIVFAGLHALVIIVMQLSAMVCVRVARD